MSEKYKSKYAKFARSEGYRDADARRLAWKESLEQQRSWTFYDERKFMENLMNQRFNYLLIFFSIFVAAAVSSDNDRMFIVVCVAGSVLTLLIWLMIFRAFQKFRQVMKICYQLPDSAIDIVDVEARSAAFPLFSVNGPLLAFFIPAACCLSLIAAAGFGHIGKLSPLPDSRHAGSQKTAEVGVPNKSTSNPDPIEEEESPTENQTDSGSALKNAPAADPTTNEEVSEDLGLNNQQQVFMLFYAIFWGSIANVQGRWKAFHLPLWKLSKVQNRIIISIVLLNLFPFMYFSIILLWLGHIDLNPADQAVNVLQVVAFGVLPAIGIFGFYRLWLAQVESEPNRYYYKRDDTDPLEVEYKHIEPVYYTEYSDDLGPKVYLGNNTARGNLAAGMIYILGGLLPALILYWMMP